MVVCYVIRERITDVWLEVIIRNFSVMDNLSQVFVLWHFAGFFSGESNEGSFYDVLGDVAKHVQRF